MSAVLSSFIIFIAAVGQVGSPGDPPEGGFFIIPIDSIEVPGKEPGALTELLVEEGQLVELDQQIAQIDDKIPKMQVQVAKSKLRSAIKAARNDINKEAADAQTEVYQAELETALDANSEVDKTVSETEIRRLRFRVKQGKLSAKQAIFEQEVALLDAQAAYAEMQQAEAMVEQRKIKSPVIGMVNKVYLRKGNWASPGEPIVQVVRMDQLRVKGRLDTKVYSQPAVRGKDVIVTVILAGGGTETFNAKIGHASPLVDTDNHFEVWAQLDNRRIPSGGWILTPGLDASIKFR